MVGVLEWAKDNWFGILGILIGVLVAVGQVFWQRQPKTLDYEVCNKLPLLAPQAHEASRGLSAPLHLYYGDELVRNPYLLTVRIRNTGKKAVEKNDYAEPITLRCERNEPFDGFVSASRPPGLDPIRRSQKQDPLSTIFPMRPDLLNAGDWFDLQLLSDGDPGRVEITARFTDQSRPMRDAARQRKSRQSELLLTYPILSAIIAIIAAVLVLTGPFLDISLWTRILALTLFLPLVVIQYRLLSLDDG